MAEQQVTQLTTPNHFLANTRYPITFSILSVLTDRTARYLLSVVLLLSMVAN